VLIEFQMAIVHLCIILCLQVVVTLWSVDGLWKLVYPVCMYRVPKEIAGFSGQLKYVDTYMPWSAHAWQSLL